MGKAKTSQKLEKFSGPSIKPRKISKAGLAKIKAMESHDPTERLADPRFMVQALIDCFMDGDEQGFKEILKAFSEAVNITKALKKAHLSQRTFYKAISPSGNPSLKTTLKIMDVLKVDEYRQHAR